jgi:hypothetical protein
MTKEKGSADKGNIILKKLNTEQTKLNTALRKNTACTDKGKQSTG